MADHKDTILVVDDTPDNILLLESILHSGGFAVRAAISGDQALTSIRRRLPDLILLDINMPGMNGYEVCRTIKADSSLAEVPVIFVSGAVDTADKVHAFEEGGVDYVTKPFQASEVLARVKAHLALASARRELEEKTRAIETTMLELKQAQAQLVQSEKMAALGMLTAGIAHELNNPLNFIAGSVQALKKVVPSVERLLELCEKTPGGCALFSRWKEEPDNAELCATMLELVDNACYGANRAAEIVKGLRVFTRLDEADFKAADINENLDAVLLLLHNRYKDRIRIVKEYGALPSWICQPGKLNQVFMNLVANAVDAIYAKPDQTADEEIRIVTRLEGSEGKYYLVVEIVDTGVGMTPEVKQCLFQPFFTTKGVGEGVGLGLAIAHGIVKDHGGAIEVATSPGKGSLFRVILPQDAGRKEARRS